MEGDGGLPATPPPPALPPGLSPADGAALSPRVALPSTRVAPPPSLTIAVRDETDRLERSDTGGEDAGKSKRKLGQVWVSPREPRRLSHRSSKKTSPEFLCASDLVSYSRRAVNGDPVREHWLDKFIGAITEAHSATGHDKHDNCLSTFLLRCFEKSTYQELDSEKYNVIMEQLLSNIQMLHSISSGNNAPRGKFICLSPEVNETKTKRLRKMQIEWLLLDGRGHSHVREDNIAAWTDTQVTSRGIHFKLFLDKQEPPSVSRLLFMADVPDNILDIADIHPFLRPSCSKEFNIRVISSDEKIILLQTLCFGRDFFVMDNLDDLEPPVLTRLPLPPTNNQCGMGIMRRGNGYVVAELEQVAEAWHISYFSSSTKLWYQKLVCLPPDLVDWSYWEIDAVLVCAGMFWWLDLRRGLLSCSCNSLLEENDDQLMPLTLEFTALPNVSMEQAKDARFSDYPRLRDRCVAASGGHMRYVHVHAPRFHPSKSAAAPPLCDNCRGGSITAWTLDHSSSAWTEDQSVMLADVWKDKSYGSTHLPKEVPEFPRVDPFDANVIYFSLKEDIEGNGREFGINLHSQHVTSCSPSYKGLNSDFYPLEPVLT